MYEKALNEWPRWQQWDQSFRALCTCQLKNKPITNAINYVFFHLTEKILFAGTTGASGFQGTRSGHMQVSSIVLG